MLDAVLCATNLCVHRQKLREAEWERGRQSESPLVPGACHKLPKLLLHPLIHSVTGCLPLLLWLLYNCLSLCLCVLLSLCLSVCPSFCPSVCSVSCRLGLPSFSTWAKRATVMSPFFISIFFPPLFHFLFLSFSAFFLMISVASLCVSVSHVQLTSK